MQAEGEAARKCIVDRVRQVGGEHRDPAERLDPLEQIADFEIGIVVVRILHFGSPAEQHVGFVEQQDRVGHVGRVEQRREPLLGLADIFVDDPRQIDPEQVERQCMRERLRRHRLAGAARAGEQHAHALRAAARARKSPLLHHARPVALPGDDLPQYGSGGLGQDEIVQRHPHRHRIGEAAHRLAHLIAEQRQHLVQDRRLRCGGLGLLRLGTRHGGAALQRRQRQAEAGGDVAQGGRGILAQAGGEMIGDLARIGLGQGHADHGAGRALGDGLACGAHQEQWAGSFADQPADRAQLELARRLLEGQEQRAAQRKPIALPQPEEAVALGFRGEAGERQVEGQEAERRRGARRHAERAAARFGGEMERRVHARCEDGPGEPLREDAVGGQLWREVERADDVGKGIIEHRLADEEREHCVRHDEALLEPASRLRAFGLDELPVSERRRGRERGLGCALEIGEDGEREERRRIGSRGIALCERTKIGDVGRYLEAGGQRDHALLEGREREPAGKRVECRSGDRFAQPGLRGEVGLVAQTGARSGAGIVLEHALDRGDRALQAGDVRDLRHRQLPGTVTRGPV